MLKDFVRKHSWKIKSFKEEVSMKLAMIVFSTDVGCDDISRIRYIHNTEVHMQNATAFMQE